MNHETMSHDNIQSDSRSKISVLNKYIIRNALPDIPRDLDYKGIKGSPELSVCDETTQILLSTHVSH